MILIVILEITKIIPLEVPVELLLLVISKKDYFTFMFLFIFQKDYSTLCSSSSSKSAA